MIAAICVGLVCAAALFAQHQTHRHERAMRTDHSQFQHLQERVRALEAMRAQQFDPAAFDDLKSKVEALRLAQGLKGSR